ncbi:TRAP transporter large permease subunit [bacterium]|nr:TRAP transporter large permease subunit [bacterium]
MLLGIAIAIYALLGGPLFVVLAAVTLLGIYKTGQGDAGFGFLTTVTSSGRTESGRATSLFLPWCGKTAESPLFIAIPLFTFAGTIMAESKTPERLVNLARALLGWLPGGVALVALVACSAFTAFTGASGVTIIALGGLLYPVLRREGYPDRFSLGLLTTCGSLGLLFPPSLPVIIYGLIAAIDIDRLFTAAILPGILLVVLLALYSSRAAIKNKVPRRKFTGAELARAFRAAFWELPLGPIVIGGIYRGWITAAEASAVTAFYALIVQVLVYRDIKLVDVPRVIRSSMVLVGAILLILGMALGMMGWLTEVQVPQKILALMESHVHDRFMFLLMLNVFILIVGCFMEGYSATLVVVPLVAPIARNYGVDSYHLGVIFLLNLEIAYSLPPVGFNLFLSALRFGKSVVSLYKAAMDFVIVMLVALLVVTYYPPLSLCLFDVPGIEIDAQGTVSVGKGEEKTLTATVTIGGVGLKEARERERIARDALAVEEKAKTPGTTWDELLRRSKELQEKIDKATPGAAGARVELSEIRAKMAPLEPAAARAKEAENLVLEIGALGSAIEWRSRLQPGLQKTGLTFATKDLELDGEHEITATTIDGHKHVTQDRVSVVVKRKD